MKRTLTRTPPLSPFSLRKAGSELNNAGAVISSSALAAAHAALSKASQAVLHAVATVRGAFSSSVAIGIVQAAAMSTEASIFRGRIALLEAAGDSHADCLTDAGVAKAAPSPSQRVQAAAKSFAAVSSASSARLGVVADAAESYASEDNDGTSTNQALRKSRAVVARAFGRALRIAAYGLSVTSEASKQASTIEPCALPGIIALQVAKTAKSVSYHALRACLTAVAATCCGSHTRACVRRVAASTPPRAATTVARTLDRAYYALPRQITDSLSAADAATGAHAAGILAAVALGRADAVRNAPSKTD
jgi:hypothetical protein